MSTVSPPSSSAEVQQEAAKAHAPDYSTSPGRFHFMIRRLHSFAGLLFGGYITVHLLVNATGLWPRMYQQNVDHIHALEPMLPLIEIAAIFLPLLIHTLYGVYISKAGVKFNTTKYNYGGNVRYSLQRWTAWILLLFVLYHVGTLHKWGFSLVGLQGQPAFNPKNLAYQSTVKALQSPYASQPLNIAIGAFYLLGIWSAVFHFANGLWTSAIAWGLTVTRKSQERWGHVCLAIFLGMMVVGTVAWSAFTVTGNSSLPESATHTLSEEASEAVHGQATGGEQTAKPVAPGVMPDATAPK